MQTVITGTTRTLFRNDTRSIQQNTCTHTKHNHNNNIATTPKHIANCFPKQFTNTVKHATQRTNRCTNRATHTIQGYNITLTTTQIQEAIKQSKINKLTRSWQIKHRAPKTHRPSLTRIPHEHVENCS